MMSFAISIHPIVSTITSTPESSRISAKDFLKSSGYVTYSFADLLLFGYSVYIPLIFTFL